MTTTTKHRTLDTTKAHNRRILDAKIREVYEAYAKQSLALIARAADDKVHGAPSNWVTRVQARNGYFTARELRKKVIALYRTELGADEVVYFFVSRAQIRASVKRLSSKELGNVVRTTTRSGSGYPRGTLIWFVGPDFNDELSFHSRTFYEQRKNLK